MTPAALEIRRLTARYGKRDVLADVSLRVEPGEWFCLLGPNGVGKSTLLHCAAGRLKAASGEICIAGCALHDAPLEAKRRLGYACAPDELPGLLTGRQCLEIYASAKGLAGVDPEIAGLAGQLRFSGYLDACVDTYSLGTRQKLCVLLALLGAPSLIVLDEAFNGLDPASALTVKQAVHARLHTGRCALLLATHSLDIVEHHADRAALLLDGRIAREWSTEQLTELRGQGANAFEEALASTPS
jgi:ABC-2 type transport system ATP-binding protein